jgi:transcriptional regulator with PAS, ATPase and Fis domain
LQHAIERSVILSDSEILQPDDFVLSAKEKTCDDLELDSYNLEDVEKNIIEKVLRKNKGNITQAAKDLGLTRASLYRRLEKYGL